MNRGRSTIKSVNRGNAETGAVLAGNGAMADMTGMPPVTGRGLVRTQYHGRAGAAAAADG